ncbi:MAG: hypothetical protein ACRD1V_07680 [Vicinamibacterales bacterium]
MLNMLTGGITSQDVEKLAELLEVEIGIPVGLLRPDDRLSEVFAPFTVGNPVTWMMAEMRLEDGLTEVRHELFKRLTGRGGPAPTLETVRDLFRAWCGIGS